MQACIPGKSKASEVLPFDNLVGGIVKDPLADRFAVLAVADTVLGVTSDVSDVAMGLVVPEVDFSDQAILSSDASHEPVFDRRSFDNHAPAYVTIFVSKAAIVLDVFAGTQVWAPVERLVDDRLVRQLTKHLVLVEA